MWRRGWFLWLLAAGASAGGSAGAAEASWLEWFSPALRDVRRERLRAENELAALGTPMGGQTVPEFGYMHPRLEVPPPASPWVQVDLEAPHAIDWIALVPAQVDWHPVGGPAYGFPRRFRIDVSDDPAFETFSSVALFTDADFPEPGNAPVAVRGGGRSGRFVRVTVTKLAEQNAQHFFALGELMVISGRRNVAIGRPLRASAAVALRPRWAVENLVDGRTPLGPPVERMLLPYDGLYAGPGEWAEPLWMRVDLGRVLPLQEVRVHPVHARLGADIPGYAFPARFRIEAAEDLGDSAATTVLLDATESDYPNPGNNPVTVRADGVRARYVTFTMMKPALTMAQHRFGLSELEVYAGDRNVARAGAVTASVDHGRVSRTWPKEQLIDGVTSYGRLIELPEWLAEWERRRELGAKVEALAREQDGLEEAAGRRAVGAGVGLGAAGLAAAGGLLVQQKRRRARELERLRTRLARDLHDEIGSNLAGLGVLSEAIGESETLPAGAREDWREVNRIARETTDAMREVLWVVGAREEAGVDLMVQLEKAAARMLPGREVRWTAKAERLPTAWPAEARRQVFLFFKEAVANVARHAPGAAVELAATCGGGVFELVVADRGGGFDPATARTGVGLASLRERARELGGVCAIESQPGAGTRVTLRVPVPGCGGGEAKV